MDKPNILLITTDQQRFDTINALGNQHIYTPHLNWLVDQGVTFTRCYSDSPICMPARATIMTGKHGYTTGLTGNSPEIKPMAILPLIQLQTTGLCINKKKCQDLQLGIGRKQLSKFLKDLCSLRIL